MTKQSDAKEIPILLKKYDKLIKAHYELSNFQEPTALLIRRTGQVQFFENATKGTFQFTHTDGSIKEIMLNPTYIKTFNYGRNTFKGYILDEDNATPLPDNPYLSSELHTININKTLNDQKNWHAKEIQARTNMVWAIVIGIAIIIVAFGLYILPIILQNQAQAPQTIIQTVQPSTANISHNLTTIFT